ncbi:MAG TPA: DsbA family oxidoreductase [Ktedonobacterales bacterium]|nr:DsbA family oxidoreductase [Ktedonobacterales bacterium]
MNVEIWSDVVCPWCYIGKRRFESALAQFPHREAVNVVWRSFELDPNAPPQYPGTLDEMLANKMGMTPERAATLNAGVIGLAAGEGLDYHLDIARPGNTFDAHRLLQLAKERGLQAEAKERLMRGYFTEGMPVGDGEALVSALAEVGIDADEARAVLAGDEYAADVLADEQRAAAFGIHGVPFVAIDERYGVSGAQPVEVFLHVLETAWAASQPLTLVGSDMAEEDACEGDSCAI